MNPNLEELIALGSTPLGIGLLTVIVLCIVACFVRYLWPDFNLAKLYQSISNDDRRGK